MCRRTFWVRLFDALTQPLARRHARELFDLVSGFVYSQVLLACQQLRLFDRLAVAPLSARQLARESDLPLIAAERLFVSALALRLVQRRPPGADGEPRFGLGPLGAAMVDNPAVAAMVEHHPAFYADLADPVALLRSEQGGRMEPILNRRLSFSGGCSKIPSPGRVSPRLAPWGKSAERRCCPC